MTELTREQQYLADAMSEISEDCWCAGWLIGLEFDLWQALAEGPREYGAGKIGAGDIARLRLLSDECGGWIAWRRAEDPRDSGEEFVPIGEWRARYAEARAARAGGSGT